jgi:hypothetical protein
MAKTTFKKKDTKEETPATTEVAPAGGGDITSYNGPGGSGWDVQDIRIPYLSLVQKSGNLSNEFSPGSFVFNKELVVADGKEPIEITILRADKYFVEDIDYDPDIRPKRFNTREEFLAEGYSLNYEAEMKVKEAAELVVLLPVDEQHAVFTTESGQGYVRAAWICQSSAFGTVGRTVATAMMAGHLRDGVHKGKWALTSELRSSKAMSWFVPIIRSMGRHEAGFLEFVETQCIL